MNVESYFGYVYTLNVVNAPSTVHSTYKTERPKSIWEILILSTYYFNASYKGRHI